MSDKKAKLVIISGPSGVGKSTICAKVVERCSAFLSVSMTTRSKGNNEIEGKDYWFISKDEFETKIENDELIEYAEVFGNHYGTPQQPVEDALKNGQTVLLEIDIQGGQIVKRMYKDAVMVFILPPSQNHLADRINGRGRGEDDEAYRMRIDKAGQEIAAAWQFYDHMVINEDLETAVNEIVHIIES